MLIARVATFEDIDMAKAQASMPEAEAILQPVVESLPGYQGRIDLAARDGSFISVTLFDTEENAAAAEPTFDEELPRRLGELFQEWGGRRTSVGHYFVVGDKRA